MEKVKILKSTRPIDPNSMTQEEKAEFLEKRYALYEQEGFANVFWTGGQDFSEQIGQPFEVIRRTEQPKDDTELWPTWVIRFGEDFFMTAYPEEVIPSEMLAQGCPPELLGMCSEK